MVLMKKSFGLATRCVHGASAAVRSGAVNTPIYASTTFAFASNAELLDVVEGRREGDLYTRYGTNPTIRTLEAKLASLEGAESSLVFTSGMAAEAAAFLAHGRQGILCIGDAYGGTLQLLTDQLPELGFITHFLLADELERLEDVLRQGVGLVFFETPTNPTLTVFDVRGIAAIAHRYDARVMVDNTFATPVNQQPLALGADLVAHSATKFLGGHSDITGGVLLGPKDLLAPATVWRSNLGQTPAPEVAHLLMRSLSTLMVRLERQNANALAIANVMSKHPRVRRVLYPGLEEFPGHRLARAQMNGFGGMLTLDLDDAAADAAYMIDKLRLFAIAPSLGGVESLATLPYTTSHHGLSPEERIRRGISETMVRLSIGIEEAADLIADLQQALE
jgi:cystathionine gamma-synthase